jgi:hypothetical protein
MPGQVQRSKGNPAYKRASSTVHKATRERSWTRGKTHKQRRISVQLGREAHNKELRAAGKPVAWETACAERRQRRIDAGLPQAWAKRHESL